MRDYDKTWEIVESMARTKLLMNDYKGRIEEVPPGKLLTLATKEIDELRVAVANNRYMDVIEETADVLNFVMAAAHQVIHVYRNKDEHTRQTSLADNQTMDYRADIDSTIRGRPQLGGSSNSPRDSETDGSVSSDDNKRDPARIISRHGRSEDGGHTDSNERKDW